MDKKKEQFEKPSIVIIELGDNDLIITESSPTTPILPFTGMMDDPFKFNF